MQHSKEAVNRAGVLLQTMRARKALPPDCTPEDIGAAFDIVDEFRATHQSPLTRVTMGLRSMVTRETTTQLVVAQRLKRTPQIIAKLGRYPSMKLARMEDVGGCRAVLQDEDEVRRVLARIESRWVVKRLHDYIAQPKAEGYRGVHVITERSERRIEVQLRTTGQQAWANAVETFAGRWNLPLKDGLGPDEVIEYFRAAGEGLARDERGEDFDKEFEDQFTAALGDVQQWMLEHQDERSS